MPFPEEKANDSHRHWAQGTHELSFPSFLSFSASHACQMQFLMLSLSLYSCVAVANHDNWYMPASVYLFAYVYLCMRIGMCV